MMRLVDIARGHVRALEFLQHTPGLNAINLGTGNGVSVLEMLRAFERVNELSIPYNVVARRPGDAAITYANPELAATLFNWRATHSLDVMCRDAWNWQSNQSSV